MEQHTIETGADVVTVIAEPGALTFATRKEWREVPESCLDMLERYETARIFKGTTNVYFLLRNLNPFVFLDDRKTAFRLVRISTDEETGKQVFHAMDLSPAEGYQALRNRLTLWD